MRKEGTNRGRRIIRKKAEKGEAKLYRRAKGKEGFIKVWHTAPDRTGAPYLCERMCTC